MSRFSDDAGWHRVTTPAPSNFLHSQVLGVCQARGARWLSVWTHGGCLPVSEDGHGAVPALPSKTWLGEPCASPVHRSALLGGTGPPGAAEWGVSVRVTATCCPLCKAAGLTPRDRPSPGLHRAPARTVAPGHCAQRTPAVSNENRGEAPDPAPGPPLPRPGVLRRSESQGVTRRLRVPPSGAFPPGQRSGALSTSSGGTATPCGRGGHGRPRSQVRAPR